MTSEDFQRYFAALTSGRAIIAHDAQQDPLTCEFSGIYLCPNNITSMLDIPVVKSNKMAGIICCEHCGDKRQWSKQEIAYVQESATPIGKMLENL